MTAAKVIVILVGLFVLAAVAIAWALCRASAMADTIGADEWIFDQATTVRHLRAVDDLDDDQAHGIEGAT